MNMFLNITFSLDFKEPDVVLTHYCKLSVNSDLDGQNEKLTYHKMTKTSILECDRKLSQTECFDELDCLCLFYSDVVVLFNNDVLAPGGVAILDCRQPITYTVEQSGFVYFIFIPHQFCDELMVPNVALERRFIYSIFISHLLGCIDNESDVALSRKMLPFIYLLVASIGEAASINNALPLFDKIKDAIHTHALDPLFSLDEAASLFFCSKRTLHNYLSSQGLSYSKLVQDYRINHLAEQLVANKKARVETLCYESGFNSVSYAIKKFKAAKGLTPKQYRHAFIVCDIAAVSDGVKIN